jgi:hypothetical protein
MTDSCFPAHLGRHQSTTAAGWTTGRYPWVLLRQRKQAHEARDRGKESVLQAQIAELDKQADELQR